MDAYDPEPERVGKDDPDGDRRTSERLRAGRVKQREVKRDRSATGRAGKAFAFSAPERGPAGL